MENKIWQINIDGTSVDSVSEVLVPWLEMSLKAWFAVEENAAWWSLRQFKVYSEFLKLTANTKLELGNALQDIYSEQLKVGRIQKMQFENIFESIDWKNSHICVPQLYDSDKDYILMLPETKWKLADSDITLELEVLYTNGKIELVQEMSGLWNRVEWFEDYLERK